MSLQSGLLDQADIAVANVVGSNIYSLLGSLDLCALETPGGQVVSPSILAFDLPVVTAVAFSCPPILFTGFRIDRWEGALFLGYYTAYTGYPVVDASGHAALPLVSSVTIVVLFARERRRRAWIPLSCARLSRAVSGSVRSPDPARR